MNSPDTSQKQAFWTPTRIALLGSALLLTVAIISAFYSKTEQIQPEISDTQPAPETAPMPAPRNNPPAPGISNEVMRTSIKLINGKSRKLSDYSGKVLVVDLWATWCGPCRQEIPHLVEVAEEYKSKGVEVLGLTTEDPETDAQLVKEFSERFKINYPIGWADMSMAEGLMNGRNGIPQTIIIGRDGKVKKHFVGFSPAMGAQMRAVLDEALASG